MPLFHSLSFHHFFGYGLRESGSGSRFLWLKIQRCYTFFKNKKCHFFILNPKRGFPATREAFSLPMRTSSTSKREVSQFFKGYFCPPIDPDPQSQKLNPDPDTKKLHSTRARGNCHVVTGCGVPSDTFHSMVVMVAVSTIQIHANNRLIPPPPRAPCRASTFLDCVHVTYYSRWRLSRIHAANIVSFNVRLTV